jgi:hypothetical protein
MLESTNALVGALTAVLRELRRSQLALESEALSLAEEEELGPFVDQLHEALADLSAAYEGRLPEHPKMIPLAELREKIASEAVELATRVASGA